MAIEGLEKVAGREGTKGGSEEDVETVDVVVAVVVNGTDGGDGAEGWVPGRSHGFGGDAIVVANKVSWESWILIR